MLGASLGLLLYGEVSVMIIAEPKYKYGQQEQVTVRDHNRSNALEQPVLKYLGGGRVGAGA